MRPRLVPLAALSLAATVAFGVVGCSDDDEPAEATTTTEADGAEPGEATTTTAPAGPLVRATMGPDVAIDAEPDTCTIDGSEGEAAAEGLEITVESDATAHITWSTEAGELDVTVPVEIDGTTLAAAGAIADGTPYSITVVC